MKVLVPFVLRDRDVVDVLERGKHFGGRRSCESVIIRD